MPIIHAHPTLLGGTVHAISDKKLMQQAGVIGVAQVFSIELPIALNQLARIAQNFDGLVHETLDHARAKLSQVRLNGLCCFRKSAEQNTMVIGQAQCSGMMGFHVKVRGHAALSLQATAKWHANQLAFFGIAPAVVNADMIRFAVT